MEEQETVCPSAKGTLFSRSKDSQKHSVFLPPRYPSTALSVLSGLGKMLPPTTFCGTFGTVLPDLVFCFSLHTFLIVHPLLIVFLTSARTHEAPKLALEVPFQFMGLSACFQNPLL